MLPTANLDFKITPVILCGGSGTRLWPLSRNLSPKQFHLLLGDVSLFQQALMRVKDNNLYNDPIIVANQTHHFLVKKELDALKMKGHIILEPCIRNTTPAITLAALAAIKTDPDSVLLVMPSDHIIDPIDSFNNFVREALSCVLQNVLLTFGIAPTRPETGYGYIQYDISDFGSSKKVLRFVEKPDLKQAEQYLASGNFLWNSGLFLFQAKTFLSAVQTYQPLLLKICEESLLISDSVYTVNHEVFDQSPSVSIDYGIMEKAQNIKVFPLPVNWSDLGSWEALWQLDKHDTNGNTLIGDVMTHHVSQSYIRSEGRLVTVVGLDNIIVVDSKDAVLVASKQSSQDIKYIVEKLKQTKRPHVQSHASEERPWGRFQSIDKGERFQVKRITVNPGQKLSLQLHHHRAEHWIVVSGTAKVTRDEEELMIFENQSIYIPCGTKHRLENPGKIPLELIEVQSGSYLHEDDIVRFGDDYGRV